MTEQKERPVLRRNAKFALNGVKRKLSKSSFCMCHAERREGRACRRIPWQAIAESVNGKDAVECRRRMETLTESFKEIEEYRAAHHKQISDMNEEDFKSLPLATKMELSWYYLLVTIKEQPRSISSSSAPSAVMVCYLSMVNFSFASLPIWFLSCICSPSKSKLGENSGINARMKMRSCARDESAAPPSFQICSLPPAASLQADIARGARSLIRPFAYYGAGEGDRGCPFCRGCLRRVNSCDLWMFFEAEDIEDVEKITRDNLQRLFLYIEKLRLLISESVFALYDAYETHLK